MKFLHQSLFLGSFVCLASASVGACGDGSDPGGDGDGNDSGDGDGAAGSPGEEADDDSPTGFCESDKACRESDQICDTIRRVCVECLQATDCSGDATCEGGECKAITPCVSSKDCSVDQVCADSVGYCVECVGDNDCGVEQACSEFECFDTCSSDKDCRTTDGVCNTDLGICVECVASTDCGDAELCTTGGVCVSRVCEADEAFCSADNLTSCNVLGDGFVSEACANGCDAEAGECQGADECEVGEEGCECYPDDTCDDDFSCLSNLCVDPGDDGMGGSGTGGTDGTGGETASESCSSERDYRGSCSAGTVEECRDGHWTNGECAGCGVLTPASMCAHVNIFAIGAPPLYGDYSDRITSISQSESGVEMTIDFTEADQIAIIQFRLNDPTNIETLSVSSTVTSGVVDVSLEDGTGVNGCTYPLVAGSINKPAGACWTETYGTSSPASAVSIRLNAAGPGTATLMLTDVTMGL